MNRLRSLTLMALLTLLAADGHSVTVDQAPKAEAAKSVRLVGAEQWVVFETSFTSVRKYDNPFLDVQVDVVFSQGDRKWVVPAFWAGQCLIA